MWSQWMCFLFSEVWLEGTPDSQGCVNAWNFYKSSIYNRFFLRNCSFLALWNFTVHRLRLVSTQTLNRDNMHIPEILSFCSSFLCGTISAALILISGFSFQCFPFPLLGHSLGTAYRMRAQASAPLINLPFPRRSSSALPAVLCVKTVASYAWSNFPVVFIQCSSKLTYYVMTKSEILAGICFWDIWALTIQIEDKVQNLL